MFFHLYVHSVSTLLIAASLGTAQGQLLCTEDSVRLNTAGSFTSSGGRAGRVEICQCSGNPSVCSWQTVSAGSLTAPFSWKNSIVVCRELDYFDVQSPILQDSVLDENHADDSVDIYPTTFVCDGSESKLIDCNTGEAISGLTHKADAYVFCQSASVDGKIRLVGSASPDEGVAQYYYSAIARWVAICPDFWRDVEANVFCKSLGYIGGTATTYQESSFSNSENVVGNLQVSGVTCSADQTSFSSCRISTGQECAQFASIAGAICVPQTGRADGSVRLYAVDGFSRFQRVEVLYGGRWGTVCDTAWEMESGEVACAELGNSRDLTEIPTAFSPVEVSSRPIWIRGYSCEGSESRLRNCPRPPFPIGYPTISCLHEDDAGLFCDSHPRRLSGGEIAAIVIAVLIFVGTIVLIIVLEDKRKKGELQAWYYPRKARFLRWYNRQQTRFRQCCSCCKRRRRRENQPRPSEQAPAGETPNSQPSSAPTGAHTAQVTPSTSTPQPQPVVMAPVPSSNPPKSQLIVPTAPPSYDDALQQQHVVRPPPEYMPDEKKEPLPYPDTPIGYNPAYPPN